MTHEPRPTLSRWQYVLAGLAAGGVAAVVASLASLALRSPYPALLNSASVTVAILIAGVLTGLLWSALAGRPHSVAMLIAVLAVAFVLVVAGAVALQTAPALQLLNVVSFCVPLAALTLAILGALTPVFVRSTVPRAWVASASAGIALAIGIALAGRGNVATGRLVLPQAQGGAPAIAGTSLSPKDVAEQHFVIDPSQSKASYSVREQLANLSLPDDAVGTTSDVSGTIFLDGQPSTVSVGLRTFKSDQPTRDSHLLRDPGLANFAPAQFTTASLDLPNTYKAGDTVTQQVAGTMTINNVEKPMTFSVEWRLQDNTLFIHGQTDFTWSDFAIPKPTFSGVLQIADTIHAEVLLVAKAQS
jgi:polyisoprenoid-binding protein YceI